MNLYLYLVLVILSIVLIIIRIKDRRLGFLGVVVMITCWSLVARSTEPSADILSYNNVMTGEYSFLALGLFFEPVLWAFHQYVYRVTSSTFLTWVLGDIILLSLCYLAIKNLKSGLGMISHPRSLAPFYPAIFGIILVSWPYYVGFYLTYRQLLGAMIFLYALSQIKASLLRSLVLLMCACLTHNSLFLFAPVVLYVSQKPFLKRLAFLTIPLIPFILVQAAELENKESHFVGTLLVAVYPIIAVLLSLILAFLVKTQRARVNSELIFINFFIPYISVMAWLLLPNGFAERIGMLTFTIILPILIIFIVNNFRDRNFILFVFAAFVATPVVTFYSTMLS